MNSALPCGAQASSRYGGLEVKVSLWMRGSAVRVHAGVSKILLGEGGTARCGAVRCVAVRCGAVRCGAVRCGAVRC
eukprot:1416994-Prymnesium_polylepis.1